MAAVQDWFRKGKSWQTWHVTIIYVEHQVVIVGNIRC